MYEYIILKRVKITTRVDAYEENKDHHDNIYVTYKRAYFPWLGLKWIDTIIRVRLDMLILGYLDTNQHTMDYGPCTVVFLYTIYKS